MRRLTPFAAILSIAGVLATQPAASETIVVYDALDFAGSAAKAFTAKTGIVVHVIQQETGEVLGKISAEGNNPKFDLVWIEGSAVMDRMGQNGVLQAVPELAKEIDYTDVGLRLLPASRFYYPTNVSVTAIAVNTNKVPADKMPKSWADLDNPEYAGAVAAKDPNLSGPAFQWLAGMYQTVGLEPSQALLKKVLTNKTLSGLPSGGVVNKALLTGKAKVAIAQDSATFSKIAAGEPLAVVYPTEGVVALPSSIGVSAKTAHLDAARKFIAFVLSKEGQAAMLNGDDPDFFFVPLIKGVAAKPGRQTNIAFVYLDDQTASAHEVEWKKWFRDNFVP